MKRQLRFNWKRAIWAGVIFMLIMMSTLIYSALKEGSDLSRKPIPEFNALFNRETQVKLQHPYTFKSKIRQPESNYIIDNGFHLTVFKLVLKKNAPLNQILNIKNTPSDAGFDVTSDYASDSNLTMKRTVKEVGFIANINLKYEGYLKLIAKNDSLICYYLKLKEFSLSHDNDSGNDIFAESTGRQESNLSLAFIRKSNAVYVIMLFRTQSEYVDFPANMLYNMVKK